MEPESLEYDWAWVTADTCLCRRACELVYAYLVPSGATTDTVLYDGENATGDQIVTLKAAAVTGHPFKPGKPVYCCRGLFVDIGTSVTGVFVQWRALKD